MARPTKTSYAFCKHSQIFWALISCWAALIEPSCVDSVNFGRNGLLDDLQLKALLTGTLLRTLLPVAVLSAVDYARVITFRLFLFEHPWKELEVGRPFLNLLFAVLWSLGGPTTLSFAIATLFCWLSIFVVRMISNDHEISRSYWREMY